MKRSRVLATGALTTALTAFGVAAAVNVNAHGSMSSPASRTYTCFQEGAESPDSAACRAAVAAGGTQAVYDWHEVNIGDAAGRHRQLIPDGRLCSAGRDKYRGFDLARADWPATRLQSGADHTFSYRATAPHRGSYELYVTRDGYNPNQPLRWSDLEAQPFLRVTDPPLSNGAYQMSGRLPAGKSGRHIVYAIWQRSDSPEAFYSCSDVDFSGGGTPSPTTAPPTTRPPVSPPTTSAPPTTRPPVSPPTTSAPPTGVRAWAPNRSHAIGDLVTYQGRTYRCRQAHTTQSDWTPDIVPALWLPV
jgi:predicted carbohydrate-binding protein with CBM5 and CBM33 domain